MASSKSSHQYVFILLIVLALPVISLCGCEKVPTFDELAGKEDPPPPAAPPVPEAQPVDRTPPKVEPPVQTPPPKTPEMVYDAFVNMDPRLRSDQHLQEIAGLDAEFRRQITELDLAGSNITDNGAKHLVEFPQLQVLIIDRTGIRGPGMAEIGKLTGLVELSAQDTRIDTAGLQGIAGLTNLEYLDLTGTSINDLSFEHLLGMKNLQVLKIGNNQQLQGQGLAELGKRGVLTNLLELYAPNTYIGNEGLVALKGMPHLEVLYLGNASISEVQLPLISGCNELIVLNLDGAAVGNNSLKQLVKLNKLEELSLKGCSALTDDAFNHIKNLKSLTQLNVNNTQVSEQAVQTLKEKFLPDTTVLFRGKEY
ncbi:MAG: hypothetical protein R3B91_13555 [Planctomycetaceae bacterium]